VLLLCCCCVHRSSPFCVRVCGVCVQYERHYPMYRGQYIQSYNNPSGLTEVVIGCAGNIEGHTNDWLDPVPGWCAYVTKKERLRLGRASLHVVASMCPAYRTSPGVSRLPCVGCACGCSNHNGKDYGYGIMNVHNDTTLSWTFYTATNSSVADEFTLVKDHATAKPKLRGGKYT